MTELAELELEVSPEQTAKLLEQGEVQLVDVREPYEYEAGHIAGAIHIELVELTDKAGSLDSDLPVVCHCRGGSRSAMAAEALRASGYRASNMAGGLQAWAEAGLPLEPQDGEVAKPRLPYIN